MKRYQARGNPREWGDWIVAVVDLPSHDLDGYRSALQDLVDATRDMSAFLTGNGEMTSSVTGKMLMHFTLRVATPEPAAEWLHEHSFWTEAVNFEALHPLIRTYIRQVNTGGHEFPLQDEDHSRGAYAIAELALKSATDCRLLGELLFDWDMDHATFQYDLINNLFIKHGVNPATLDLLACWVVSNGQSKEEQLAELLYGLKMRSMIPLPEFAARCAPHVQRSDSAYIGLHHFALIWAAGDESEYHAVWQEFRRAGIDVAMEGFEEYALRGRESVTFEADWNRDFRKTSVDEFTPETLTELAPPAPVTR